jgi:hypothetical protein
MVWFHPWITSSSSGPTLLGNLLKTGLDRSRPVMDWTSGPTHLTLTLTLTLNYAQGNKPMV